MKSKTWKHWVACLDFKTCLRCRTHNGKIYQLSQKVFPSPPLHNLCRCNICVMDTILAGHATNKKNNGADYYIKHYGKLPNYYISKNDAKNYGWRSVLGNLFIVAPNKMIGGDVYKNREGKLPSASGRIWYEADFDYNIGWRNGKRVLYSNDGIIFVTYDHYETFYEII